MKSFLLKETVEDAQRGGLAVGHFNVSNLEMIWAVFEAAQELNVPVIIGVSEGERLFIGVRQALDLVRSIQRQFDYPIFINADHSYSFESAKAAIDAGYDSVIIDGAKLPYEQNVALTKKVVDYAHSVSRDNSGNNRAILVEGELGYIGQSSKVLDAIPDGVKLGKENFTSPSQAHDFISQTGVDLFAPAVGNIHGMLRGGVDPHLDIELVYEIKNALHQTPLVLHGGSGTPDEDFSASARAGMGIIHISTELRVAYRKALENSLSTSQEVAPYKYLAPARKAVKEAALRRLKLFAVK